MLQTINLTADRIVNQRANFLRFDSTGAAPLSVRAGGQDLGQLWPGESVRLPELVSLWELSGATGTVRIGVASVETARRSTLLRPPVLLMEAGANQVTAGNGPGWVSGDVANLAAAATATVVFDLGADWQQYSTLELVIEPKGPSTGLNPVQIYGSDTTAKNTARRRGAMNTSGPTSYYSNFAAASGPQHVSLRPAGRYLVVEAVNADAANATGHATKMTLTAFPS